MRTQLVGRLATRCETFACVVVSSKFTVLSLTLIRGNFISANNISLLFERLFRPLSYNIYPVMIKLIVNKKIFL